MKIIGKYNSKLLDENNNLILQLSISDFNSKKRIEELDKTKTYNIEIKEVKSKRSLQQNKLLWEIIGDLAAEMSEDKMSIYINLLKEANCNSEWLKTPKKETIEAFKDTFRAVEYIRSEVNQKGIREYVYKVYLGSSKFSVSEMNHLIDIAISWASEFGLNYDREAKYE